MAGINFIGDEQYSPKLKFRNNMETENKTTQDLLAECEYKISRLESQIAVKNNELLLYTTLLDKLKEQRKNYLNYLNSDNN